MTIHKRGTHNGSLVVSRQKVMLYIASRDSDPDPMPKLSRKQTKHVS
jgi:hypothetical protein